MMTSSSVIGLVFLQLGLVSSSRFMSEVFALRSKRDTAELTVKGLEPIDLSEMEVLVGRRSCSLNLPLIGPIDEVANLRDSERVDNVVDGSRAPVSSEQNGINFCGTYYSANNLLGLIPVISCLLGTSRMKVMGVRVERQNLLFDVVFNKRQAPS